MRTARNRRSDAGAVMILVLMVILVLFSMGLAALWTTSGNTKVASNLNLRQQALFVAEAGIERARAFLNSNRIPVNNLLGGYSHPLDDVPTMANPLNRRGAIMIAPPPEDPTLAAVPLAGIPFPSASFGRTGGSSTAPTATTMGTYTVWIRNDLGDLRRSQLTQDSNGYVTLRSQGIAPDGMTQVTLEVTVGAIPGSPGSQNPPNLSSSSLCSAGKNACDENNSTAAGIVAQ